MSDPDQGAGDKSFLARWSQRKHEAKQSDSGAAVVVPEGAVAPVAESDVEPEFDLASLPKLEEISASTDITAFLRKGVPQHLRNAALRKSWALDPAIRNYVSPALDYAYDWNTLGGVPGSSEIEAGLDIGRLISQIMGPDDPAVEAAIGESSAMEVKTEPALDPSPEAVAELPVVAVRPSSETLDGQSSPADATTAGAPSQRMGRPEDI